MIDAVFNIICFWFLIINVCLIVVAFRHRRELDSLSYEVFKYSNFADDFKVRAELLEERLNRLEKNEGN